MCGLFSQKGSKENKQALSPTHPKISIKIKRFS